jgi:hypothetical protein
MKYLIILIVLIGGGYYYQHNLNDCETQYDVRDKIYESVDRINELARKINVSSGVTYYDFEQELDKIRGTYGDGFTPKMACYGLDVIVEEMERKVTLLISATR